MPTIRLTKTERDNLIDALNAAIYNTRDICVVDERATRALKRKVESA